MPDALRAIVVDDDAIARKAVMFSLIEEDFCCDYAVDGEDALLKMQQHNYDLVVTDLRMPNKHGHALSIELLKLVPRPMIVVHTAVDNPAITKDLLSRGVNDIVFKPTNYASFAAKMRGFASYRKSQEVNSRLSDTGEPAGNASPVKKAAFEPEGPPVETSDAPVTMADLTEKIPLVSKILPMSKTAFEVFELTRNNADTEELAAIIQQDAGLAAEFLSIANSSFYNPAGNPITDLEKAVVRIGQRRIGEMALASAALSSLSDRKLRWMDMSVTWKQSIAAGAAVEHLVKQGRHSSLRDSLVLTAIMHTLGRVVLGTLYPAKYQTLVERCRAEDVPLVQMEADAFPETHSQFMSRLLLAWNIPEETCEPLRHILTPEESLNDISNTLRTRIELAKLAIFIGQLAAGAWHPWDLVDIPKPALLKRLRITDIGEVVEQTRKDTEAIIRSKQQQPKKEVATTSVPDALGSKAVKAYYKNLAASGYDFLGSLIHSMGLPIVDFPNDDKLDRTTIIINCLGVNRQSPVDSVFACEQEKIAVVQGALPPAFDVPLKTVNLPSTYGKLVKSIAQRE